MSDTDKEMIFGNLHIHPASRTVEVNERKITLTRMEFNVLCFLASNSDIAFTKNQIYEAVSRDNYADGSYIIRDIVYRLRAKLGITNIQTLHGYGYKFSVEN